jgi:phenylacetate-CoA ligase
MPIERILRRRAADFIAWRDGVSGSGPAFRAFQRDARRSREGMREHASQMLAAQIAHARATVPYYSQAWAGIELPSGSFTVADLERLPLLNKSVIRDRSAELKSTDASLGPLGVDYTGGTTGTQVSFYRDHQCRLQRMGRQRAVLDACGYERGMRRALVWGAKADLGGGARQSLRARLRQFAGAQIILPSIVLTEAEMAGYAARMREFRPEVLYGYPNALTQFAEYTAATGNGVGGIHTIITTAERLSEKQRRTLHEVFGGEVFNLYCSREYGCVGFECSRHEGLHIDTGSVCVEILRDGKPVPEGEVGEIVVTDLLNRGMPLVRSATGDQASLNFTPCECGSRGSATSMAGRPTSWCAPMARASWVSCSRTCSWIIRPCVSPSSCSRKTARSTSTWSPRKRCPRKGATRSSTKCARSWASRCRCKSSSCRKSNEIRVPASSRKSSTK